MGWVQNKDDANEEGNLKVSPQEAIKKNSERKPLSLDEHLEKVNFLFC